MTDNVLEDMSSITLLIEKGNVKNQIISQKGSYWHLEHSLKVLKSISKVLIASKPDEFNPTFSLTKWGILLSGKIPRGKGRAPKQTISNDDEIITKEKLNSKIEELNDLIQEVKTLPKNSFFHHPLFKDINHKWAIRFMSIHTRHHLAIIDDILKK